MQVSTGSFVFVKFAKISIIDHGLINLEHRRVPMKHVEPVIPLDYATYRESRHVMGTRDSARLARLVPFTKRHHQNSSIVGVKDMVEIYNKDVKFEK